MAKFELTAKQRERIARGPLFKHVGTMATFNQSLKADPAKLARFNSVVLQIDNKLKMYRGGVLKFGNGGIYAKDGSGLKTTNVPVPKPEPKLVAPELDRSTFTTDEPVPKPAPAQSSYTGTIQDTLAAQKDLYKPTDAEINAVTSEETSSVNNPVDNPVKDDSTTNDPATDNPATETTENRKTPDDFVQPVKPEINKIEATKVADDPRQSAKYTNIKGADDIIAKQVTPTADITAPDARDAQTVTTEKVTDKTKAELQDLKAAQGEVSNKAQVAAQTMDATSSAIKNINAAEIDKAQQIDNIPKRKVAAEELISGSAVKSAEVEQNLAKLQAAQMDLDPMATTQGQLNKLLQDFDAGNPPPWAAAGMRAANAVLNQRGLGASSIAGQAIIQAQMESAIPIAQTDAQVVFNLGIQNLSNRQQRAVLAAQQRAQFLGQKFDQEFQTRVTNAAKISDIANQNFNAEVQITMENSRMAQSVDLANLNNRQALVMANAAQTATLETANLNNRQQAAVQNAQAFLQMDMANLQYEQQTQLFKTQEQIKSLFTDAASENAAKQFNASSQNQVNQFYDSISNETKRFNAQQKNALEQFNVSQSNSISQFNNQQQNAVDQFNASNGLIVSQANAQWRQQIATIDTATQNQVNQFNAQQEMELTVREYEGMWQVYKDKYSFAHDSAEGALDRDIQYGIAMLQKEASIEAAKYGMTSELYQALGALGAAGLSGTNLFSGGANLLKSLGGNIKNLLPGNVDVDDGDFTDEEKLEYDNYQDVMEDSEYSDIKLDYDPDPSDITYEDDLTDLSYGDDYK